jgi:hypothetical protein
MADGIADDSICLDHCDCRNLWLVRKSTGVNRIADRNKEMSHHDRNVPRKPRRACPVLTGWVGTFIYLTMGDASGSKGFILAAREKR